MSDAFLIGLASLAAEEGVGQTNVEMPASSFRRGMFSFRAVPIGMGDDEDNYGVRQPEIDEGEYRVTVYDLLLRAQASASSKVLAHLNPGDIVHVFGDSEVDYDHIIDPVTHAAIPNPNPQGGDGITYLRVGTPYGPGWVAGVFLSAGSEPYVPPAPVTKPLPTTPPPVAKTDNNLTTRFLVGGLIGVAVVGGVLLAANAMKKRRSQAAYA